jgi:outer membrane lipoprotein-sorting protein
MRQCENRFLRRIALSGFLFLFSLFLACDQQGPEKPAPGSSGSAEQEIRFPKKLDFFRVDVDVSVFLSSEENSPTLKQKFTVTMKSPDKFRVESREGPFKDMQICDGEKVFAYDGLLNEYWVSKPSEPNFEIGHPRLALMGNARQIIDQDWAEFVSSGIKTTALEETVTLNGESVRHVVLSDEMFPIEFWMDQTPDARLKKVRLAGQEDGPLSLAGSATVLEYSNWVVNPTDPPEPFVSTPPTGARKVERSTVVPKLEPAAPFTEPQGMDLVWSYSDYVSGMVVDQRNLGIMTLSFLNEQTLLSPEGKVLGKAGKKLLPSDTCALSISDLEKKEGLLVSSVMNAKGKVIGCDLSGKKAWEANTPGLVEALVVTGGDDDSTKTVIVGSSVLEMGHLGRIQALEENGKPLWENKIENPIKDIYAVDLDADGTREILAVSLSKTVEQFDLSGRKESTMQFPTYLDFLGFLNEPGKKQRTIIGFDFEKGVLQGYDDRAKEPWRIELPGTRFVHSAESAVTRPWLALSTSEGRVYILDLEKKSILRQFNVGEAYPKIAWLEAPGQTAPRLLLVIERELRCYALKETNP